MIDYSPESLAAWAKMGVKKVVFEAAREIAENNPRAVFISPDVGRRFRLDAFAALDPKRFLDTGISEQAALSIAGAYAAEGIRPFVVGYAPFVTARALDQIRVLCGAMNLPITIVGADAGYSSATLGPALTALEDVANLRAIPNMTVLCPADCGEIVAALLAASRLPGPSYIRIVGGPNNPLLHHGAFDFTVGKARIERAGTDVVLVSSGLIVTECLQAAALLEKQGLSCQVVNMHTVQPLDTDCIDELIARFPRIVSVEEHSVIGGLGAAIAEYLAEKPAHPPLTRLGTPGRYLSADTRAASLMRAGLSPEGIAARVLGLM